MNKDLKYLAVNKKYFGSGLKPIEILIIAQIEEFERNEKTCYITDKQLAYFFGVGTATINRALRKLNDNKIIKITTTFTETNGKISSKRILETTDKIKNYQNLAFGNVITIL